MSQVTEEEFLEWKQHPVTRAVMAWAASSKESLKEQWAAGAFTDQEHFATAIKNAKAIGNCQTFEDLLDLDPTRLEIPE